MKEALFHPAVRKAIQSFPVDIRKELGRLILGLQQGAKYGSPISKPMPQVGKGVEELRIKDATGAYRAFYLARNETYIMIFHAFKKKTQKTPLKEIQTGKLRLMELNDD